MFYLYCKMLTKHANAYLYCKSIQNKLSIATIYQKITYISYDILSICIKNAIFNTNIQRFA